MQSVNEALGRAELSLPGTNCIKQSVITQIPIETDLFLLVFFVEFLPHQDLWGSIKTKTASVQVGT